MNEQAQTGRNKWDFLIVVAALGSLLIVVFGIVFQYSDPEQAKGMLEFVLPTVVAIASAAFGISQAGRAQTAEKDASKTKEVARRALSNLEGLKSDIQQPFEVIETALTSPSGTKELKFDFTHPEKMRDLKVHTDTLASARERMAKIEAELNSVIT